MLSTIISCIKGAYTLKATGRFPERILNIASTSGIYIQNVKRTDCDTITFCVSKKGGDKLLQSNLKGLELSLVESFGVPVIFSRYKKRVLLFFLPLMFVIVSFVFSLFIWRVEITGGDEALRAQVKKVISENGIKTGALKYKIDQYDVKKSSILQIDDLSWLWVDIKGSTAKVKIHKRIPTPPIIKINEPSNVIATHSGVIEKMQVYCGLPLVKEGMTVEKGQVIISGVFESENENIPTYYHHATGNVVLRVFEEKVIVIPKKTVIKKPTGKEKKVFCINFEKNNVKFSLNSGISYSEYDKIEKKYVLSPLPVSFSKIIYREAVAETVDTDFKKEYSTRLDAFKKSLTDKGMEIAQLSEETEESEHGYTVTFRAQCLVRTDKEIPIIEGEANGENS